VLNDDERAIIAATVKCAHLAPSDSTALLSDSYLPLSELSRTPSVGEPSLQNFMTYDGAGHVSISDELVNALRAAANLKSVSLRRVTMVPRTKGRYHDSISRPGIAHDGLRAVIVHFDFAGGGACKYFEKRDARWQVVAGGLGWEV
jgi:hypothetical protein